MCLAQPLIIRYFCFDNNQKRVLSDHFRCHKIGKNIDLTINQINIIRAKYQSLQQSDIQYHKEFTPSKTSNMIYVSVTALKTIQMKDRDITSNSVFSVYLVTQNAQVYRKISNSFMQEQEPNS